MLREASKLEGRELNAQHESVLVGGEGKLADEFVTLNNWSCPTVFPRCVLDGF